MEKKKENVVQERISALINMSEITIKTASLANDGITKATEVLMSAREKPLNQQQTSRFELDINKLHTEFNKISDEMTALLDKINGVTEASKKSGEKTS